MKTLNEVLSDLVGEQLSAVTFVQDYLQLDFDGDRLTVLVPIEVVDQDFSWVSGHPDFRNQLCDLIGKSVVAAEFHPELLTLNFAGREIRISLRDEVYIGPEALTFQPRNEPGLWVV